jgi:3-oxoacyl-[acyl-carrier protein] reductase
MTRLAGTAVTLDITSEDAPARIADRLAELHGGVDIVVHNAGITRDKKLANMSSDRFSSTLEVNLRAPQRITEELLERQVVRPGGAIIGVASISGIAGNPGQTNYATSKAGVIGLVDALSARVADRSITVNAVAPGFIETQMTARMPLLLREAGRRMNSMSQGGLPVDVAETVSWFASPGSAAVSGNVVRVDGQSLLGA